MYSVSKNCRLCLSKNIKVKLKLKSIPLGEKYFLTKKKASYSKEYPLSIGRCSACKNIQLMEIINPNILWKDYTYISGQTKEILNHFQEFAKNTISRFKLSDRDLVLDIGSNDGSLLSYFKKSKIKVLGIDPSKNITEIANKNGIETITGLFDKKIIKKIKKNYQNPKVITAFNVFAHTAKLREMLYSIKNILHEDGVFIFEVQYLGDILNKNILGTFFHEHMYHHSVTSLKKFFNNYNMTLFDVERVNVQKGSIIGYVCKKNRYKKTNSIAKLIKFESQKSITTSAKIIRLNNFIKKQKYIAKKIFKNFKKKNFAIYGAARSGPLLAENLCETKYFKYILDDHKMKKNKFSGYKSLKVYPTSFINKFKPTLCVILAYLHSKKIIKKNYKYLKNNGKFIVLYPSVKLIDIKNYKKYIS
jgi:2-polyprenyl-3-methyl-5-hydroxy-6-metoxy-1,4-benzoquinol methylase